MVPLLNIILGVGAVLAVFGLSVWFTDRGYAPKWWHWVLLGIWGLGMWFDFAWLGTLLGEGEPRAAWLGFAIFFVVLAIIGLLLYRLVASTAKSAAKAKTAAAA